MNSRRCRLAAGGTVMALFSTLCAPNATAQQPVERLAGSLSLGSHVGGVSRAVAATDDLAVWGQGAELVVGSPDGAARLSGLMLAHVIEDIFLSGQQAYVAAGPGGLYVVDLADPGAPAIADTIPLPPVEPGETAFAVSVVVQGHYAYAALSDSGLWAVDLDDPSQFTLSGANLHRLALGGSHLLALDTEANMGYQVWDLGDPAAPHLLGEVEVGTDVSDLALAGGHVYLATRFEGLQIRAWTPAAPLSAALVGALDLAAPVTHLAVVPAAGRVLAATAAGLAEVNVAAPAAPVLESLLPGAPPGQIASAGAPHWRVFVAAGQAALPVLQLNAEGLSWEREHGLRGSTLAGTIKNGALFLAQDQQGVSRLSLANPARPAPEATAPTGFWAAALANAGGDRLALADGGQILSISPGDLGVLGAVALPGGEYARDLAAAGETVYAAASGAGVCAVSLAEPAAPELLSCADTGGEAVGVALAGSTLYVADGANGVVVVDAADPRALAQIGHYAAPYAYAVAVVGGELYVSDVSGEARLLRLARGPGGALTPAGEFDTEGFVRDVALDGRLVYLANEAGLQVLERLGSGELVEWARYASPGGAAGVIVHGDVVYLLDTVNGLLVLTPSGQTDTGGTPRAYFIPWLLRLGP